MGTQHHHLLLCDYTKETTSLAKEHIQTTHLSPQPKRRNPPILHQPDRPSRRRTDGDSENHADVNEQALLEETWHKLC